jgi:hypothetical protein
MEPSFVGKDAGALVARMQMREQTQHAGAAVLPGTVVWDAPVYAASTPERRNSADKLLLRCNFVIWFVNLGILLPRALL